MDKFVKAIEIYGILMKNTLDNKNDEGSVSLTRNL